MNSNFGHPSQPVFMVDSGRGHPKQHRYYHQQMPRHTEPPLVPCWTFPPARAEIKKRDQGRMYAGMAWVVTLLLLLVFAALGLGAYQILKLQFEVQHLSKKMEATQMPNIAPQKQVGLDSAELNRNTQKSAAHLIGHAYQSASSGIMKWEEKFSEAFTKGVKYINGGLQVNETGLYFVYSRVEFFSIKCNPTDYYVHKVCRQRNRHNQTIMEDHQEGLCKEHSKNAWMTGSHLGSVQQLQQSDLVFVNVSHPHLLSKNYHSNYFGLFKIQ
ncbi:hypothetical protein QQF64_016736 [Cirrhinus molitorella]|uniref:THD domain-containing protein n=1 Tax=Cirrhinus molitorella TaxID=172907 RepID=A0ABR3LNM8_9TELE